MAGEGADVERRGLSRRDMIRASAAAGVTAWTAPMILDSFMSPAAAASGGLPTGCSYGLIVFTYDTDVVYDLRGLRVKVKDSAGTTDATRNIRTDVFDSLGRRTQSTDPDLGTWLFGPTPTVG